MLTRILALLVSLFMLVPQASLRARDALRSGDALRMHVIAHDDTPAMQAVKLPVRDAVQALYAAKADLDLSMLQNAQALLPQLTAAAQQAALEAGFDAEVRVLLGAATFDARTLDGVIVPAGDYPALIIRLGDGLGHNWWGLIDPRQSLLAACAAEGEDSLIWDWSADAFWQALLHSLLMPRRRL